mmetsp:Transcript_1992/g.4705  ORF Transcript_1992/g.4705 Transcript_1992/m.4705 type:complete len:213 (-) Transcript_1992:1329-1967(-)
MEQITGLFNNFISSRIASEDTTLPPPEFTRSTMHLTCLSRLICRRERIISYESALLIFPSTVTTATFSRLDGAPSNSNPREERIIDVAVLVSDSFCRVLFNCLRLLSNLAFLFNICLYLTSDTSWVALNLLKLSCRPNIDTVFSSSDRSPAFSPLTPSLTLDCDKDSFFFCFFFRFSASFRLLKPKRECNGSTGGVKSTRPISSELDDVRLP